MLMSTSNWAPTCRVIVVMMSAYLSMEVCGVKPDDHRIRWFRLWWKASPSRLDGASCGSKLNGIGCHFVDDGVNETHLVQNRTR